MRVSPKRTLWKSSRIASTGLAGIDLRTAENGINGTAHREISPATEAGQLNEPEELPGLGMKVEDFHHEIFCEVGFSNHSARVNEAFYPIRDFIEAAPEFIRSSLIVNINSTDGKSPSSRQSYYLGKCEIVRPIDECENLESIIVTFDGLESRYVDEIGKMIRGILSQSKASIEEFVSCDVRCGFCVDAKLVRMLGETGTASFDLSEMKRYDYRLDAYYVMTERGLVRIIARSTRKLFQMVEQLERIIVKNEFWRSPRPKFSYWASSNFALKAFVSDDLSIIAEISRSLAASGYHLDAQKASRWAIGSKTGTADPRTGPLYELSFSKGEVQDHRQVQVVLDHTTFSSGLIYCSVRASSKSFSQLQLFQKQLDMGLSDIEVMTTTQAWLHRKFPDIAWITRLSSHLIFDTMIRMDLLEQLASNQGWKPEDQKIAYDLQLPESLTFKHEKYEGSFTASSIGYCALEGHDIFSYDKITSELTRIVEATQEAVAADFQILRTQARLEEDLLKNRSHGRVLRRDLHVLSRAINEDGLSYIIVNPCGLILFVKVKRNRKSWKPVVPMLLEAVPVTSLDGVLKLTALRKISKQEAQVVDFLKDFSLEQLEYVRLVAKHILPESQNVI